MRLNMAMRRSIVDKIMADVPRVNYGDLIVEYIQREAYKLFPEEVRAIYDNPLTRRFLMRCHIYIPGSTVGTLSGRLYWPSTPGQHYSMETFYPLQRGYNSDHCELTQQLVTNVRDTVSKYAADAQQQGKDRESMRRKLDQMLGGITSVKQAKVLLEPELHKYLPVEPPKDPEQRKKEASRALVPYVVASLREMGWPKEEEVAA